MVDLEKKEVFLVMVSRPDINDDSYFSCTSCDYVFLTEEDALSKVQGLLNRVEIPHQTDYMKQGADYVRSAWVKVMTVI